MVEEKKRKFIKQAIPDSRKGIFKAKAEKAGKSTEAYAREHEHDSGKLGKESRLAETLIGMHKAHKTKSASHKTIRNSFYGTKE